MPPTNQRRSKPESVTFTRQARSTNLQRALTRVSEHPAVSLPSAALNRCFLRHDPRMSKRVAVGRTRPNL